MKRLLVALLAAHLLCSAGPAVAKPDQPSAADDAKARSLFKQGDAAYAEGRYEDALGAFEEAYRLSHRPRLMFNIGNALERLGKLSEAADALEKYLPHAKPTERDVLSKRVQNLRKRAAPTSKVVLEEEEEEPERKPEREPKQTAPAEAAPRARPVEPRAADSGGETTLGYVLLGAGGVAMGAGAVFGLMALSARKDVDAGCKQSAGQTLCDASARDAVDRDQRYSLFADLGLGLGLVAAGAGTYFLLTAPSVKEQKPGVAAGFALQPSGGTLRVHGEF